MCLNSERIVRIHPPRHMLVGYKPVYTTPEGRVYSQFARSFRWNFGKLHTARSLTEADRRVKKSNWYSTGIHAYRTRNHARTRCPALERGLYGTPKIVGLMKVLLLDVTYRDPHAYRATHAIPIEMLDPAGHRIPWPGVKPEKVIARIRNRK